VSAGAAGGGTEVPAGAAVAGGVGSGVVCAGELVAGGVGAGAVCAGVF